MPSKANAIRTKWKTGLYLLAPAATLGSTLGSTLVSLPRFQERDLIRDIKTGRPRDTGRISSMDNAPEPQWLVQEPEGNAAPKTPGRWKAMWASDCMRLEDAHQRGDEEVPVFGRKYVVNMKERTVKPLYWEEDPPSRPVIRGTYFVRKGHGWLPFSEIDATLLEDFYSSARVQLHSDKCEEAEVPLSDGEHKVVMTRTPSGEPVDDQRGEFGIDFQRKPIKPPSILTTTFTKTSFEVRRGTPEHGSWGGVSVSQEDVPKEGQPPKHLVFVVHGIGESLWSRSSSSMASLRVCCAGMRDMSAQYLEGQRRMDVDQEKEASEAEEGEKATDVQPEVAEAEEAKHAEAGGGEKTVTEKVQDFMKELKVDMDMDKDEHKDKNSPPPPAVRGSGAEVLGDMGKGAAGEGAEEKKSEEGQAGYVEFLPVEWFNQVHGKEAEAERLIEDITLPSIPGFRDFANQAILDVMYYLTPDIQARIVRTVTEELNAMWEIFCKFTPGFTGKVSVIGHSLGSVIVHDILMAQPARGEEGTEVPGGKDIPILKFEPEVLLVCGSPIGTFLCLRGINLEKQNLFKFKTVKRFFNLFHLYDPVAYRLEPLLDRRLRDLPPEHVPHKGGDRIHVTVKKFRGDVNAALGRMTKTTAGNFQQLQKNLTSTLKNVTGSPGPAEPETPKQEVSHARDELAERIDWVLQESPLEGMHPWASAVFAHGSYFQNMDMIMFLLKVMNEEPAPEGDEPIPQPVEGVKANDQG